MKELENLYVKTETIFIIIATLISIGFVSAMSYLYLAKITDLYNIALIGIVVIIAFIILYSLCILTGWLILANIKWKKRMLKTLMDTKKEIKESKDE